MINQAMNQVKAEKDVVNQSGMVLITWLLRIQAELFVRMISPDRLS